VTKSSSSPAPKKASAARVVSYNRADERLTIEGLNLVKRHLKRTQDGQGGITET
jgi:ribosomal protein L24